MRSPGQLELRRPELPNRLQGSISKGKKQRSHRACDWLEHRSLIVDGGEAEQCHRG